MKQWTWINRILLYIKYALRLYSEVSRHSIAGRSNPAIKYSRSPHINFDISRGPFLIRWWQCYRHVTSETCFGTEVVFKAVKTIGQCSEGFWTSFSKAEDHNPSRRALSITVVSCHKPSDCICGSRSIFAHKQGMATFVTCLAVANVFGYVWILCAATPKFHFGPLAHFRKSPDSLITDPPIPYIHPACIWLAERRKWNQLA